MVKKAKQAQRLVESGNKGVGTVAQVNDTGITINDDPRVEIVVRVEPVGGGAAVERRKKSVVPRVSIPRVGDRYPVWYNPDDPSDWIMGTAMDEAAATAEVKDMFARAKAGGSAGPDMVGELERLNSLRVAGALTDEEFAQAKRALLDR